MIAICSPSPRPSRKPARPRTHVGILRRLTRPDPSEPPFDLMELERGWGQVPVSAHVPGSIARRIELAKDLYRYSYFRYGFRDTAFLYILLAYEAALREVFPQEIDANLSVLIDSADRAGLIPDRQPVKMVHLLRQTRNAHMHGRIYAPLLYKQEMVLRVIDLINCVFDEEARVNCPPLYVRKLLSRKRQQSFMAGFSEGDHRRLNPGDSMAFAGDGGSYEPGTYTCLKCGRTMHVKRECRLLPLCPKRGCKCGAFKFEPLDSKSSA
jgi:hypothetical protein